MYGSPIGHVWKMTQSNPKSLPPFELHFFKPVLFGANHSPVARHLLWEVHHGVVFTSIQLSKTGGHFEFQHHD